MELITELVKELGDLGGLLVVVISLFMFVAFPLGFRYMLSHTKVSPAEEMDRRAHPENFK